MSSSFCHTFNSTFDVTEKILKLKRKFHVGRVGGWIWYDYFAYDCWPVSCRVGTTWKNQYLCLPCVLSRMHLTDLERFSRKLCWHMLTWQSFSFRCHKVCKETHGEGPARRRGGAAASARIEVQIRFHSYTRSSNGLEDISISKRTLYIRRICISTKKSPKDFRFMYRHNAVSCSFHYFCLHGPLNASSSDRQSSQAKRPKSGPRRINKLLKWSCQIKPGRYCSGSEPIILRKFKVYVQYSLVM